MKIIFTGCTGVGKTTGGLYMKENGFVDHFVREDWAWSVFRRDSDEARSKALQASMLWLNTRIKLIRDDSLTFVMDRGPMDVLHHWAVFNLASPQNWNKLAAKSRVLLEKIDLVVFFPWQSRVGSDVPLSRANEARLVRRFGGYHDIFIQSMLLGITYQLIPGSKILVLPRQATTVRRVHIIMERINALRSIALASPEQRSVSKN